MFKSKGSCTLLYSRLCIVFLLLVTSPVLSALEAIPANSKKVVTKSALELKKDMLTIVSLQLIKGKLETTAEYERRLASIYAKFDKRTYKVSIQLAGRDDIVEYNPDTELLTISLPDFGNHDDSNFSYAILEVGSPQVKRLISTVWGGAIISKNPQIFSVTIPRKRIKGILYRGKLMMVIKTDLQVEFFNAYGVEEPYYPSLLILRIADKNVSPSFFDPDKLVHQHLLPVRLISVSLMDEKGAEIFQAQGAEQDAIESEQQNAVAH
jgi:hypothetical protein